MAATTAVTLAASGLAVTAAEAAPPGYGSRNEVNRLVRAVTLDGTLRHLRAMQKIADVNDDTRVSGTGGYDASAGYVAGQLVAAGYDVTFDQFTFPFFAETGPTVVQRVEPTAEDYAEGTDYAIMSFSGSGDVTAPVEAVDVVLPPGEANSSTSGCEAEDFAGFTPGNVALIQRGTCAFGDKAANAEAAGASAVLIFNEGQEGRTEPVAGTLGGVVAEDLPVVGLSFAAGQELAQTEGAVVRVATETLNEERSTYNVIAETRGGRTDNVVMAGAHLDSVEEGPGINDNASGAGALLEVAIQLAGTVEEPRNKVRFAWWAAEEAGLLGSEHYVTSLSTSEIGDIAAYLNFDMVGSPNYVRFVYDGDDSDAEGAGPGPEGSAAIERVFERYYESKGLAYEGTDFTGRSDYGPFIAVGIPAGGLFTGAEGIKTEEQEEVYGGEAGVAYDPCYHEACDTILNVDNTVLRQNADAIAYAVGTLARSTKAVNDRTRAAAAAGAAVAGSARVPEAQIRRYDAKGHASS